MHGMKPPYYLPPGSPPAALQLQLGSFHVCMPTVWLYALLAARQALDKAIAQTSLLQEELQPSDFPTSQGKAFYGALMNTRLSSSRATESTCSSSLMDQPVLKRTCLQLIDQGNA